jgi:peroxiredoxin
MVQYRWSGGNTLDVSLKPGDIAPRFTLPSAQGAYVSLDQSLRQGRGVLLVFLRHLG